jgi:hypothetical protein
MEELFLNCDSNMNSCDDPNLQFFSLVMKMELSTQGSSAPFFHYVYGCFLDCLLLLLFHLSLLSLITLLLLFNDL